MATRSKRSASRRSPRTRKNARPSKRALDVPAALPRDDKAQTLVYVHGIGNKPIESILKCQWDHALFGFDAGARSRLAYWVNREYYPLPAEGTCTTGDKIEVEEGPTGRALSVAAHLAETSLEEEAASLTGTKVPLWNAVAVKGLISVSINDMGVPTSKVRGW